MLEILKINILVSTIKEANFLFAQWSLFFPLAFGLMKRCDGKL